MPVDLSAYRLLYVKTALELIKRYGALKQDKSAVQELHRIAHSLKGQSLALEYKKMGAYFYLLEKFFSHCLTHTDAVNTTLYGALPTEERLKNYVEHIENTEQESDIDEQIALWKHELVSLGVAIIIP